MFQAIKKQILGSKAAGETSKTAHPYSNIPIFDDVGIIGMPSVNKSVVDDSERKTLTASNASTSYSSSTTIKQQHSTGKRHRNGMEKIENILLDKENIPKIPQANIIETNNFGKETNSAKKRRAVTIEESNNTFLDESHIDSRFTTDRQKAEKVLPTDKISSNDDNNRTYKGVISETPNDDLLDVDLEERLSMRDFLFSKVRHNHYDVVEACINGGLHDFTGRFSVDTNGNTLIHVAVQNNLKKLCALLLKKTGCDINAENLKGMTPLDYAELYHFTALSDWLLSKGALNGAGVRK